MNTAKSEYQIPYADYEVNIRRTRQQSRDDALRRHARLGRFASLHRHNILCCKSFRPADAKRPGSAFPREAWERGGAGRIGRMLSVCFDLVSTRGEIAEWDNSLTGPCLRCGLLFTSHGNPKRK